MGVLDFTKGAWNNAIKPVVWDFPRWVGGGTRDVVVNTSKKVGDIINPYAKPEERVSQSYKEVSRVTRAVNRILLDSTRLLTFSTLSRDMTEKIYGDPDIQAMLQRIDRITMNIGVSILDTGGPVGELVGDLATLGIVLKNKHSLLPDMKRSHAIAGEVLDKATLGTFSSHAVGTVLQEGKDLMNGETLRILYKGMKKLLKYLWEDKTRSIQQVGSALHSFTVKPAIATGKALTAPIRWPVKKIRSLFRGSKKETARIGEKILATPIPSAA